MEITLTLTEAEVNYILQKLADCPFKEVADLIDKVHAQGQSFYEDTPKETPKKKASK